MNNDLLEEAKRIKSIAEIGLLYATDGYNKERYQELYEISLRLFHIASGYDPEKLKAHFSLPTDYPTPKIDVRGMLISPDKKILLVKESEDGRWSLPGGWADIGQSPKEVIIKEFREETGLDVEPEKLLAVFDKKMHPHPPQPYYTYKLAFFCTALSTEIIKGFDVLDIQYFSPDKLPNLSEDRILKSQIELLYGKVMSGDWETYYD